MKRLHGEYRWINENGSAVGVGNTSPFTEIGQTTAAITSTGAGYENWGSGAQLINTCVMARHGWQWAWQDVNCDIDLAYICEYS